MTALDKKEIAEAIDGRMREVTVMMSNIERSFVDLKQYLEKLVDQQHSETTRLRDTIADLFEKRTAMLAQMAELEKRLIHSEKEIEHMQEITTKLTDNKRFNITTALTGAGLVIMLVLYLLDKVPK